MTIHDYIKNFGTVDEQVVGETFELAESSLMGFVIMHKVEYSSGRIDVNIYPDVRRNLAHDLQESLDDEQYERAAQLRDTINKLNYDNE